MKCPGLPCTHTCAHHHCDFCGDPTSPGPEAERIEEFVKNFGRTPTEEELEHSACDDCYATIRELEGRMRPYRLRIEGAKRDRLN